MPLYPCLKIRGNIFRSRVCWFIYYFNSMLVIVVISGVCFLQKNYCCIGHQPFLPYREPYFPVVLIETSSKPPAVYPQPLPAWLEQRGYFSRRQSAVNIYYWIPLLLCISSNVFKQYFTVDILECHWYQENAFLCPPKALLAWHRRWRAVKRRRRCGQQLLVWCGIKRLNP